MSNKKLLAVWIGHSVCVMIVPVLLGTYDFKTSASVVAVTGVYSIVLMFIKK